LCHSGSKVNHRQSIKNLTVSVETETPPGKTGGISVPVSDALSVRSIRAR
jgi:hypothetical protein